MATRQRCLRIAMLNADTSVPNTYADMGTFGDVLYRVLRETAALLHENLSVRHAIYNVVDGEYPKSLSKFDAVMVTASAASSYDDKPWIRRLEEYLVNLYRNHPNIRLFGSCFGHHLICQALLKDHGLRVGKMSNGWEIGITEVVLTDSFRKMFGNCFDHSSPSGFRPPSPDGDSRGTEGFLSTNSTDLIIPPSIRLQFVHEDQVLLPSSSTSLPSSWIVLGSTENCAVQGLYQPGRVLTLQGHFEFDKFKTKETYRIFGADEDSTAGTQGDYSLGGNREDGLDDGYLVAQMVLRFLCEPGYEHSAPVAEVQHEVEMLATPRSSIEVS